MEQNKCKQLMIRMLNYKLTKWKVYNLMSIPTNNVRQKKIIKTNKKNKSMRCDNSNQPPTAYQPSLNPCFQHKCHFLLTFHSRLQTD